MVSSSRRRYPSEEVVNNFKRDIGVALPSSGREKLELDKLDELDDGSDVLSP